MPTPDSQLPRTALACATALRRGDVSSTELVAQSLAVIAARNPALQALVTVTAGRARRAARRADEALVRARRAGTADTLPVFHGVPTAIKDIDMVAFTAMKAGSRQLRYFVAPVDGAAARHNRRAGAVILGKTATSELAILPTIETDIHPPARNPWHPDFSPGGSSGGAAAAVASGMLPVAHASDGAGSIRIPASFCGLVGFKPSRGILPSFYLPADAVGLTYTLCVAHDVADAAAYVDVLRGRYRPHLEPESLLARSARSPAPLRLRVVTRSPLVETDPQIAAAVERAAARLAACGHHVAAGESFDVGTIADFLPIMARSVANVPLPSYRYVQPLTAWMHRLGRRVAPEEAAARFAALRARVAGWMQGADAVLTPTVALRVPRVGALHDPDPERMFHKAAAFGAYTAAFNVSGHPAVSVPMGRDAAGLPMGLQIVGPPDGDALVLQLAHQLEPFDLAG